MPTGLRERKKQQTRDAIVATALRLFRTKGYDATTVAEIADAADISPRTFFGYFPAKEDVVFHDHQALLDGFVERLDARRPSEQALDVLRAWILELDAEADLDSPAARARRRLIRETPALAARERSNLAQHEEVLAAAIAVDLGLDAGSVRPHLVSAAALAALSAIARRRDAVGAERTTGSTADALDEALTFVRGGLSALRQAR